MKQKRKLEMEIGQLVMRLARDHDGAAITWTPDWGFTIVSDDGAELTTLGGIIKAKRQATEAA